MPFQTLTPPPAPKRAAGAAPRALMLATTLALAAAAAPVARAQSAGPDAAAPAATAAPAPTDRLAAPVFYVVATRPDLRKCAAPLCGGWFVRALNQATLRCADGSQQAECHVFQIDAAALGWGDAERQAFEAEFGAGRAIARARLTQQDAGGLAADTLGLVEAWAAQAGKPAKGTAYAVRDNGIRCITSPCNSYAETVLNIEWIRRNVAGVDLAASGAPAERVQAGEAALATSGVLATGSHKTIQGPAGRGQVLVATEFYLPFAAGKP